ncbi:hypothetical protein HELRODRAFT_86224 [Helobdella robusta]|uniref:Guanine nucleotide-binding protein subunit gamma n=1 Tax=Helobdella robusta TaxID=6412 RepID=T1G687_HELRO|nr:hypothetical protein HELRODRAFT_86224 [Helobdella robusta]ESN95884.1 hypothetical protein HELRODRAFT_86224 [Helobdella robusta]
MSTSISQQKAIVEGLRMECRIERQPLSKTLREMIQYTEQHKANDALMCGIDKKLNPFIEKSSCVLI